VDGGFEDDDEGIYRILECSSIEIFEEPTIDVLALLTPDSLMQGQRVVAKSGREHTASMQTHFGLRPIVV